MWNKYAYNVGGLLFTLDEIEHGVLRCNRGHPRDKKPIFQEDNKDFRDESNHLESKQKMTLKKRNFML